MLLAARQQARALALRNVDVAQDLQPSTIEYIRAKRSGPNLKACALALSNINVSQDLRRLWKRKHCWGAGCRGPKNIETWEGLAPTAGPEQRW